MKKTRIALYALYVIVLSGLAATFLLAGKPEVEDGRLEFSLPNLEGEVVSFDDPRFAGKVVVVDVWGTWCPPCFEAVPHLQHLYEKYRDDGLEIVGIAFEQGPSDRHIAVLRRFAEEYGIGYTVLHGGKVARRPIALPALKGFVGFPTTVFIGRDGQVKEIRSGFNEDLAREMEEIVKSLL